MRRPFVNEEGSTILIHASQGLEPYKRSVADTYLGRCLRAECVSRNANLRVDHIIGQVDENHDDEIDFNEFLLLVDHLRSFMRRGSMTLSRILFPVPACLAR